MIINTVELFNDSKCNILLEGDKIFDILCCKDKLIYSLNEKDKSTKELIRETKFKPRSVRKALFELEQQKIVSRIKGKSINRDFRFSDLWHLNKKIEPITRVQKDFICVSYHTIHYNNSFKNHYIFLPKIIFLDDRLLSALGFFHAEGSKTKQKVIEIINSEPNLMNLFINFLKRFNIYPNQLYWRISLNKKLLKREDKQYLERNAENFWLDCCKLSKIKRRIKTFNYTGTNKGKLRENSLLNGSLNINYNNVLFCIFLFSLFKKIKQIIKTDINLAIPYLRGYLAGEAYVGSHDREIQFASAKLEELYFFKKILKNLNINCSISKATSTSPPRIIITNLNSFLILYYLDIFRFHPFKKKDLILKILNYKKLDNIKRKLLMQELEKINKLLIARSQAFLKKK